jgi:hypothetical protein
MRRPLRGKGTSPQQQVSIVKTFPAPVGGWNALDALAAMKPTEAVALENFFPRPSYVETRGGHASHATGLTGTGKTLASYNAIGGTNTMYAYTASGVYDVSSAGAVGASKLARTNGKHQSTMFGDGTNNWLIAVNGVDKPAYFDGTTWTAVTDVTSPALTGYTGNAVENFVNVSVFKGRVIFTEKNSLSFWYLSAGVAGGALTEFDLSGEASKGGYLMATATWTRDGGSGVDDFFVAITSEGEAIVYQGSNPSSAVSWAKVGSYTIGKPLGRRCVSQLGGECVILTEGGAFPLSALLQSGDARARYALSFKIQNAFIDAARSYGTVFGWKAITYPAYDALLVNVPIAEDGTHEQYVMNLTTKAWCKFTKWDAEDFAILNGSLYFVKSTVVYKAWTGVTDNGSNIIFYGKQAFSDFGDSRNKHLKLFMPMLTVNGTLSYASDIDVDFADTTILSTSVSSTSTTSLWGTALWGSSLWSSGSEMVRQWSSPTEWQGRWLSMKLKIETDAITAQWSASTVIYEPGGPI